MSISISSGDVRVYGELLPVGGGDPIPLLKPTLTVGRRESADIVLRFPNVSGNHCELAIVDGYWTVKDLRSSNGTKVNGTRVTEQRLQPGDKIGIAKHVYEIAYEPARLDGSAAAAEQAPQENIFGRSLLESAGLENRRPSASAKPRRPVT
jgi:predicted component of type VI protein secretion system